jgi:hypothetical protein
MAPVFDYDGRMMEDLASGHNNAYAGGASFQQAAVEYRMTQRLASLGYRVVPCLGFGKAEKAGLSSRCAACPATGSTIAKRDRHRNSPTYAARLARPIIAPAP